MQHTYFKHRTEHSLVVDGGAVPPSVPELMLTLQDAVLRALRHAGHVVHRQLTELPLALGQAFQTAADRGGGRVVRLHRLHRLQLRQVS